MPDPGHPYDINPNEDLVAVVVCSKTLQHSSPGSESFAGRSEMRVVVMDNGVVEVVV